MACSRTSVLELVLELVQQPQMAGSRPIVLEIVLELVLEVQMVRTEVLELAICTSSSCSRTSSKLKFSNRPFVLLALELVLELFLNFFTRDGSVNSRDLCISMLQENRLKCGFL